MWWHTCNSNSQEGGQEHHGFSASLGCIVRSYLREERGEGRRGEGKKNKKRNRRRGDVEEETNQPTNQPGNQESSVLNQSDVRDSEVDPFEGFLVFCLSALKDMVSGSCLQIHYVAEDDLKLLIVSSLAPSGVLGLQTRASLPGLCARWASGLPTEPSSHLSENMNIDICFPVV